MGDYIDALPECFPRELKRIILKYALTEEQELFSECYEWLLPVKENKQNDLLSKQLINTCAILIMIRYQYRDQMTSKQKKLFNDLIPTLQL
jgi:hypothetical protein